ncbi:hypothetical protein [Candidatus Xianfuyuplasma coldseepsis]|uniref:Uncharacterized protein n=1 Tax=Candidatus Xianfuyuplasma coldseepsis TaxID=2782163 RepID=A0A7L7KUR2_9MOLU|nr:hypothetical protein [Xianfuyuplasma coldseepsis]QMS85734.1 hypothetical protein G4Z02_08245 [Xianfuyuplasma coldseepsis]
MDIIVFKKINIYRQGLFIAAILFFGYGSLVTETYFITVVLLFILAYIIYTVYLFIRKTTYMKINSTEISHGIIYKQNIPISAITDIQYFDDNVFGKRLIIRYKSTQLRQLLLRNDYSMPLEEINNKLIELCRDKVVFDGSIIKQNKKDNQGPKYFVVFFFLLQLLLIPFISDANHLIISSKLYTIIIIGFTIVGIVTHYILYKRKDEKYISLKIALISWIILLLILISSMFIY